MSNVYPASDQGKPQQPAFLPLQYIIVHVGLPTFPPLKRQKCAETTREYTGCPEVPHNFDTPLFSAITWDTRLKFLTLNVGCGRFYLMYKTLVYNLPTLKKIKRKLGQITDKLKKKDAFTRWLNVNWLQDKGFVLTFDRFWPVLLAHWRKMSWKNHLKCCEELKK